MIMIIVDILFSYITYNDVYEYLIEYVSFLHLVKDK